MIRKWKKGGVNERIANRVFMYKKRKYKKITNSKREERWQGQGQRKYFQVATNITIIIVFFIGQKISAPTQYNGIILHSPAYERFLVP